MFVLGCVGAYARVGIDLRLVCFVCWDFWGRAFLLVVQVCYPQLAAAGRSGRRLQVPLRLPLLPDPLPLAPGRAKHTCAPPIVCGQKKRGGFLYQRIENKLLQDQDRL